MLRAPSIPSRSWLLLLLSLSLLAGCGPVSSDRGAGGGDLGTSFVVVLADDLGWADISCQGSEWETPAIDALAGRGLRVARAYSNGPNCAPSRAYLMTGRDMTSHGIFTVAPSARGKAENRKLDPPPTRRALPDGAATIATELGEAGYRTAHIGKWHLGSDPRAHGFERAVAGNQRGSPKTHLAPWGLPDLPEGAKGTELADALTDQAIDFIEECGEEPFLLVLSHYAVHTPVQADPARVREWQEKLPEADRRRWRYAALVESVDRSVGRLVDALERTGRAGDTLVIFTSDNGGHEGFTDNGPLRGAKGMLYEGGIRVPFIAAGPGIRGNRTEERVPLQLSDLYPTFLEIAGRSASEELVGESLVPLLRGRRSSLAKRELHWHFPAYLEGSRARGTWRTTPASVIWRGDYKLLHFYESDSVELYHRRDVGEENDLAEERPREAGELRASLEGWRSKAGLPIPRPIPPS
ncbi:MAG: sulfatase [Planctomycetota bacterium]|jgi:arylsulfatase A-like enzyme